MRYFTVVAVPFYLIPSRFQQIPHFFWPVFPLWKCGLTLYNSFPSKRWKFIDADNHYAYGIDGLLSWWLLKLTCSWITNAFCHSIRLRLWPGYEYSRSDKTKTTWTITVYVIKCQCTADSSRIPAAAAATVVAVVTLKNARYTSIHSRWIGCSDNQRFRIAFFSSSFDSFTRTILSHWLKYYCSKQNAHTRIFIRMTFFSLHGIHLPPEIRHLLKEIGNTHREREQKTFTHTKKSGNKIEMWSDKE